MTGFTANLSNLPPGVSPADIEHHFGERDHETQCPQHDGWRPDLEDLMGVAYEVVNVWDETREWTSANETRLQTAIEELRGVLEPSCLCQELTQAAYEDAQEHQWEESR